MWSTGMIWIWTLYLIEMRENKMMFLNIPLTDCKTSQKVKNNLPSCKNKNKAQLSN